MSGKGVKRPSDSAKTGGKPSKKASTKGNAVTPAAPGAPISSVKGFTWYPLVEGTCLYGDYVPKRKSPTASDPTTAMTSADTPSTSSTTPTLMTSPVTPIQVVNRTIKLAIFDVDKTMICPRDKGRFPKDADDWEWFDKLVPAAIRAAYADGFTIVLISNQGSRGGTFKSYFERANLKAFVEKMPHVAKELGVPLTLLAAFEKDKYRKPSPSMYDHFVKTLDAEIAVDVGSSFMVGDAAGRKAPKDFSDSDRKFAQNIGVKFHTPEEYFLHAKVDTNWLYKGLDVKTLDQEVLASPTSTRLVPRRGEFVTPPQECILFVGFPATGKTTLYKTWFQGEGYVHVNQDTLGTRPKCIALVKASLAEGKSVVVDNTSRDVVTRQHYTSMRTTFPDVVFRCFDFTSAGMDLARHNACYRHLRGEPLLPMVAFTSFKSKYEPPTLSEGFDEIKHIHFRFEGTEEDRKCWTRWLDVY